MATNTHMIEIYDPSGYHGPNPMRVTGLGVVYGPERSEYYLLEVLNPFDGDDGPINHLVVRPRYFGDKIERVVNDACTVGISLVRSDANLEPGQGFDITVTERWGAGKISPLKNGHARM